MNIPVTLNAGRLPLNFEGTQLELFQAIRNRMRGFVLGSGLLTGDTVDSTPPTPDRGPWFDGKMWWFWNITQAAYVPETREIDGSTASINDILSANPTAARLVFLPDKSGTLLLVNDIYVPRALVVLNAYPFVIDWTRSNDFICQLKQNTTFLMTGYREGQKICVYTRNDGTNFTTSWPAFIQWPGGAAPAMPVSQAGQNHMVEWNFVNINGVTYGEQGSTLIYSNPANTIFLGGSSTDTGQEPSQGFHSKSSAIFPVKIP